MATERERISALPFWRQVIQSLQISCFLETTTKKWGVCLLVNFEEKWCQGSPKYEFAAGPMISKDGTGTNAKSMWARFPHSNRAHANSIIIKNSLKLRTVIYPLKTRDYIGFIRVEKSNHANAHNVIGNDIDLSGCNFFNCFGNSNVMARNLKSLIRIRDPFSSSFLLLLIKDLASQNCCWGKCFQSKLLIWKCINRWNFMGNTELELPVYSLHSFVAKIQNCTQHTYADAVE